MVQSFETLAAIRFGYGFKNATPEIRDVAQLLAQLQGPDTALLAFPRPDYTERRRIYKHYRKQVRRAKKAGKKADKALRQDVQKAKKARKHLVVNDIHARFARAISSDAGFRERLAIFWSDHFTVAPKGQWPQILYGDMMDAAIRPHLAGNFLDLLLAAVLHPSMLIYLDQTKSYGPNSPRGMARQLGLNENLARELLELHTMGVGGAYGQKDVRQLAELLTGIVATGHGMEFHEKRAEPGAETVLGKTYGSDAEASFADIRQFFHDISRHPDTAAHIARKLAVHFVADDPPEELVLRMQQAYLDSGAELMAVYQAMLEHPAAWGALGGKVKQPFGFVVSGLRALDISRNTLENMGVSGTRRMMSIPIASMGQSMLRAPGPNGWPEEAEAWITPQGIAARLQWALVVSATYGAERDPRDFVQMALRDAAGETLQFAAGAAENRIEGLALVLASPEFNRR